MQGGRAANRPPVHPPAAISGNRPAGVARKLRPGISAGVMPLPARAGGTGFRLPRASKPARQARDSVAAIRRFPRLAGRLPGHGLA